ncbi:response regulator transcription factor [Pseudonocardia sp. TRM90224]|uniref:response regulator transcription factor n=1 Tax=Pseudonocardia sp. TRM90224 TaxID=2812678 RepID=UPI001E4DE137|nr:response regulator transcription factor [Pseudonocardia sp. TRM90224]
MARVLVVDDEPGIRTAVARGLTAEGMEVVAVADGNSALEQGLTGSFDAIVLDIILPGLSGYRVLEALRGAGVDTPVLLLSAKDGEFDQADGLDLGADGYLVKPFAFVVLVAQLRALLRRRDAALGRTGQRVRLGSLVVDPVARSVSWKGESIELSPREFALLHTLASRPDTAVSKDDLLRMVWGDEQAASRNVVEVYVGYVRRKLEAVGAGHVLKTVRGFGYIVASP